MTWQCNATTFLFKESASEPLPAKARVHAQLSQAQSKVLKNFDSSPIKLYHVKNENSCYFDPNKANKARPVSKLNLSKLAGSMD